MYLLSCRWYGVELDEPVGRHDGTVQGVRYFAANDNHGVFVTESKLTKLHSNSPTFSKQEKNEHSGAFCINNTRRHRGGSITSDDNLGGTDANLTR